MIRFGVILMTCLLFCGCREESPRDRVDFKYIVAVVGERSVRAEKNIRNLCSNRAMTTNVISVIASIQSVPRDVGQSRESVWVPYLKAELDKRIDGKLLVKGVAKSIEQSISPMIVYFDQMEKSHPEWDVSQLEDVYFSHLSSCLK